MSEAITTNILLVDDLPENLHALMKIIEQEDRHIYQAESGDAALALLLEHEFALAIVDVMMPGMNGFELAELMRGAERTRNIPIVFVSAVGRETNFAFRGYESGAVDFLYKPLDIAAVKSKVNVFVALYQQRQQVKRQVVALETAQQALEATQAQLQCALQARDDFMSMVAHELRTPLNTLHLETQLRQMQLARSDFSGYRSEELAGMFARDQRQIESMNRLISDMVDVGRIQSGRLSVDMQDCNLTALLRRVVDDLGQQAQAAGCVIECDIQDCVSGLWDEFRMEQIVVNLLTNAFRYGAGKPVSVSLYLAQAQVQVQVRDRGVGIAEADQERIFHRFERVGTNEVREGLGMGLFIARELARTLGGDLRVTSRLGEGATFVLELPLESGA